MAVNVLLLLADDMNYNTIGCFGCPMDDISPNLDHLASEGICFDNAHVSIAVCQPSRQSMLTGLYPHHNGALGFEPIREDVTTLPEVLRENGYYNGIIGKTKHCAPEHKFAWDYFKNTQNAQNCYGRSPYIYGRDAAEFFANAKAEGKPFFLMANSHDPHRPFAGSEDELTKFFGFHTYASRYYTPEEAWVPGFLPDIPDVRKELAQYYSSCHRCDETIGEVLKALEESGMADDTLVIFMSDNGMAFPFSKANCYLNSTKTPFIARWRGHISPGSRNHEDYIAGIDYTATVLEAVGLADALPGDGRSYLPLLMGEKQDGRDMVFTQFNTTAMNKSYPMRCIQSKQFGYIFNAWADGETYYKNESMSGLSFRAMQAAGEEDQEIAERVRFLNYRCREEFYDFSKDPDALHNLIDDTQQERIEEFRNLLESFMRESGDPVLPAYEAYAAQRKEKQNQSDGKMKGEETHEII
ncbi:sulfatase family protein [Lacrimispora sp.]|uniref:sulfatase family protein n=1 Tax=Lacrimispora sp. TaxID=2719234 RepID=UPI00289F4D66|nr:sulfatase [Lacrimispora sp.]